jgi:Ca2+/Na+ antiporter
MVMVMVMVVVMVVVMVMVVVVVVVVVMVVVVVVFVVVVVATTSLLACSHREKHSNNAKQDTGKECLYLETPGLGEVGIDTALGVEPDKNRPHKKKDQGLNKR